MFGIGKLFNRKAPPATERWPLTQGLVRWSKDDIWTIRDAVEGTLILGATGSGKTSGSGATLAQSFLGAGFGGLVLTAKPDERSMWQEYCRGAGREDDCVVFGPGTGLRYNFLDAELNRPGSGAGITSNIVALFESILEVADRKTGSGGGDEGAYWVRACRQLATNAVDLLALAKGRIGIPDLYRLVVSAPISGEQVKSEAWKADSFCYRCLLAADKAMKTPDQVADFEIVADFFLLEWPNLSSRTRSVVLSTFSTMADSLNRGVIRSLFSGETNVSPAATEEGKVIIVDLPIKEFGEVGVFAQVIWKRAFQRWSERRNVAENTRPVFLWVDEAQFTATSTDMLFQSTCRSSRVATVLLSQSTSNFESALGGSQKGKSETASLFGNLNTKLFHANSDPLTNEWASTLIGRTLQQFMNSSSSFDSADTMPSFFGADRSSQSSAGFSQSYEYEVQPAVFSTLRTGGLENMNVVDAIVFKSGRPFHSSGRQWMTVSFQQPQRSKGASHA